MDEFPSNSTGPWRGIGFWDHATTSAGRNGEVEISRQDKLILRDLASRVARFASQPREREKVELWYAHNALSNKRTLIMADPENGWNDIIKSKDVLCEGEMARRWEVVLRKELFWASEIKDDRPVEGVFYIGLTYKDSGWGMDSRFVGGECGGAYRWEPCLQSESDLERLHFPEINVDYETTRSTIEVARETFEHLLDVKLRAVWWWGFGMTYDLARLLGLEGMMMSFYDNPSLVRKSMAFLTEGNMRFLDFLESNNLLTANNDSSYVGSGGIGYCQDLRPRGNINQPVKLNEMWGHAESQETSGVAPEMFEEFIFPYQLQILERFGLCCYGCCEPLDRRWKVVKKIPNLRRVSVSAWADKARMAEYLEDKYIYSLKPNPAVLAVHEIDENAIKKDLVAILETSRDCVVEVIMKDNHSLGGNPNNIVRWVQLAREAVDKVSK